MTRFSSYMNLWALLCAFVTVIRHLVRSVFGSLSPFLDYSFSHSTHFLDNPIHSYDFNYNQLAENLPLPVPPSTVGTPNSTELLILLGLPSLSLFFSSWESLKIHLRNHF